MNDQVRSKIESAVKSNKVVLFMKGNRTFPQCGFSATVVSILNQLVPKYETFNVLEDPALRDGIKEYSQWPTIPQLYVDGEFVGGCDIVKSLHASGELGKLLGAPVKEVAPPKITLSPSAAEAFSSGQCRGGRRGLAHGGQRALPVRALFRRQGGDRFRGRCARVWRCTSIAASAARLDGTTHRLRRRRPTASGFKIANPERAGARAAASSPRRSRRCSSRGRRSSSSTCARPRSAQLAAIAGARLLDAAGSRYARPRSRDAGGVPLPSRRTQPDGGRALSAAGIHQRSTTSPAVSTPGRRRSTRRCRATNHVFACDRFSGRHPGRHSRGGDRRHHGARCDVSGGNGHYSIVVTSRRLPGSTWLPASVWCMARSRIS